MANNTDNYDNSSDLIVADPELFGLPMDELHFQVRQYGSNPERLTMVKPDGFPAKSFHFKKVNARNIKNIITFWNNILELVVERENTARKAAEKKAESKVARRRGGKTSILDRYRSTDSDSDSLEPCPNRKSKDKMRDWLLSNAVMSAIEEQTDADTADVVREAAEDLETASELRGLVVEIEDMVGIVTE